MAQTSHKQHMENINRRNFLKLTGMAATGSALSINMACQPAPNGISPIDGGLPNRLSGKVFGISSSSIPNRYI